MTRRAFLVQEIYYLEHKYNPLKETERQKLRAYREELKTIVQKGKR